MFVILCGSELRRVLDVGAPPIVRLAADAGFDGIAFGATCLRDHVAPLVAAAASVGLVIPVGASPLGDGPLGAGRRLPHLAALEDADERRAAIALFKATLEATAPLGVQIFVVNLGDVPLRTSIDQVARRFARRELDEDEPGARLWADAQGERRALSGLVFDACRDALDRILPIAERRGVVLALELAGVPWGAPSPREAWTLVDEYRTGPIGVVWDEARMQVLGTLGLGPSAERRAALAAVAKVWRIGEAVGSQAGYLPGLGDPDDVTTEASRSDRPAGIPVVVTGRIDSTPEEVARARVLVATASGTGGSGTG
jgi:sugar phosphate isomerase/epimerase